MNARSFGSRLSRVLAVAALMAGAALLFPSNPVLADDPDIKVTFSALPAGWREVGLDQCGKLAEVDINSGWDAHAKSFSSCVTRGKMGSDTEGAGVAFVAVGTAARSFRSLDEFRAYVNSQSGGFRPPQVSATQVQGRGAFQAVVEFTQRIPGMVGGQFKTTVVQVQTVSYWVDLGGGSTAFVRMGAQTIDEPFDAWRGEAAAVVGGLRLQVASSAVTPTPKPATPTATAEPGACKAGIQLPQGLKPGDTLSPSATVASADGKPVQGTVGMVWVINGRQTNSVTWDGKETSVVLQLSCQGHAQEFRASIPAYVFVNEGGGPGQPLPPIILPPGMGIPGIGGVLNQPPPPGMGAVGTVPGPKNLGEAIIGVLGAPTIAGIGTAISIIAQGATAVAGAIPMTPTIPPTEPGKPTEPKATEKPEDKKTETNKPEEKKPLPVDPHAPEVRRVLARMRAVAARTGDARLLSLVAQAEQGAFNRDGSVNWGNWTRMKAAFQQAMTFNITERNAAASDDDSLRKTLGEFIKDPLGATKDAVVETVKSPFIGIWEAGKVVGSGLKEVGYFGRGLYEVLKGGAGTAAEGAGKLIANPAQTAADWNAKATAWGREKLRQWEPAAQDLRRAMKEGRTLDVIGALATKWGAAGWNVIKEIGGLEEAQAILSKDTGLEERMWAIPSLTTKIAGLLAGTETGMTRIPGMTPKSFIPSVNASYATKALETANEAEKAAAAAAAAGDIKGAMQARQAAKTANQVAEVEVMLERGSLRQAVGEAKTLDQSRKVLEDNPALRDKIREMIKSGNSKAIADLEGAHVASTPLERLVNAEKTGMQREVVREATLQVQKEDMAARILKDKLKPGDRITYTKGSISEGESTFGRANARSDNDITQMGLKYKNETDLKNALQERSAIRDTTARDLDVNGYAPEEGAGIASRTGKDANRAPMLEKIQGGVTGKTTKDYWIVGKDGQPLHVGSSTGQGVEMNITGRQNQWDKFADDLLEKNPPPEGMKEREWLDDLLKKNDYPDNPVPKGKTADEWISEPLGQGAPKPTTRAPLSEAEEALRKADLADQVSKMEKATNLNDMAKAGNRIIRNDLQQVSPEVKDIFREAAGTKVPSELVDYLGSKGIRNADDMLRILGLK